MARCQDPEIGFATQDDHELEPWTEWAAQITDDESPAQFEYRHSTCSACGQVCTEGRPIV